ncbi:MAG: ATP-binding protein [Bacteroidota bacterium]
MRFRLFSLCLVVACVQVLLGQTIIPPELSEQAPLLNSDLSYPENYEEALELMREEQQENQPDVVLYLGYQALQWAKEAHDHDRIQQAIHRIGLFYTNLGQYAATDSIYTEALELTDRDTSKARIYLRKLGLGTRTGDWTNGDFYLAEAKRLIASDSTASLMAHYHFAKGLYLFESSYDMVRSLLEYQRAKELLPEDRSFVNIINHNLANVYSLVQNYEKAEAIGNEILTFAQEQKVPVNELFAYYLLGYTAFEQEAYKRVKDFCYAAMDLREKTGVSQAFGYTYFLLGESFLSESQLDSAAYYIQLGMEISEAQGDAKELIDCTSSMMKLRLAQARYDEAVYYGEEVLSMNQRPDQPIREELAAAYFGLGQSEKAYEVLSDAIARNKEDNNNETNVALITALLEEQFQAERERESSAYQQQLFTQRLILLLSAAGIVLLMVFAGLYIQYRSRRKLKKVNRSLAESNAALQQFAYITSHDLKEPIRNITSFSGLLDRKLKEQEQRKDEREFLEFITSNATVLREIVDSLQIFTKISFGELEREQVPLPEVFSTVEDNLRQTIYETNGDLSFSNPTAVGAVSFSRPMLILVLQNLILNGFKYNNADQPQVKVVVKPQGSRTLFMVEDNGVGIEEDYQEGIFSPFKTLKNKSVTQSSGLGLSICKNILERYGGRIWVTSDGKNGSTFSFVV